MPRKIYDGKLLELQQFNLTATRNMFEAPLGINDRKEREEGGGDCGKNNARRWLKVSKGAMQGTTRGL
jgi:hypothetical protein